MVVNLHKPTQLVEKGMFILERLIDREPATALYRLMIEGCVQDLSFPRLRALLPDVWRRLQTTCRTRLYPQLMWLVLKGKGQLDDDSNPEHPTPPTPGARVVPATPHTKAVVAATLATVVDAAADVHLNACFSLLYLLCDNPDDPPNFLEGYSGVDTSKAAGVFNLALPTPRDLKIGGNARGGGLRAGGKTSRAVAAGRKPAPKIRKAGRKTKIPLGWGGLLQKGGTEMTPEEWRRKQQVGRLQVQELI
jgi:hypothetical protein